ncbi:MAG TPA: hypothetical protein VF785_03965 [Gemmatimonadaceae bacterium]
MINQVTLVDALGGCTVAESWSFAPAVTVAVEGKIDSCVGGVAGWPGDTVWVMWLSFPPHAADVAMNADIANLPSPQLIPSPSLLLPPVMSTDPSLSTVAERPELAVVSVSVTRKAPLVGSRSLRSPTAPLPIDREHLLGHQEGLVVIGNQGWGDALLELVRRYLKRLNVLARRGPDLFPLFGGEIDANDGLRVLSGHDGLHCVSGGFDDGRLIIDRETCVNRRRSIVNPCSRR